MLVIESWLQQVPDYSFYDTSYVLSRNICIFLQNFNHCSLTAVGKKLEFHSFTVSALHQTLSALTEDQEHFHFCPKFKQPDTTLYSTLGLSTEFINRSIFILTQHIILFLQYLSKIQTIKKEENLICMCADLRTEKVINTNKDVFILHV